MLLVQSGKNKGFVFLITVLVIGAIAAASTVAVLTLSLGSSRSSFSRQLSFRARAMADACVEEALEVIRENNKFTGSGSLSIDGNTCNYTVINTGGQTREVRGTGDATPARRKVKALVSKIKPTITLSSSQEIPDF